MYYYQNKNKIRRSRLEYIESRLIELGETLDENPIDTSNLAVEEQNKNYRRMEQKTNTKLDSMK